MLQIILHLHKSASIQPRTELPKFGLAMYQCTGTGIPVCWYTGMPLAAPPVPLYPKLSLAPGDGDDSHHTAQLRIPREPGISLNEGHWAFCPIMEETPPCANRIMTGLLEE